MLFKNKPICFTKAQSPRQSWPFDFKNKPICFTKAQSNHFIIIILSYHQIAIEAIFQKRCPENRTRHFSKNFDKRPRECSICKGFRYKSWDVFLNSSKSGMFDSWYFVSNFQETCEPKKCEKPLLGEFRRTSRDLPELESESNFHRDVRRNSLKSGC